MERQLADDTDCPIVCAISGSFRMVQPEDEYAPAKRWRDIDNPAVQTLVKLALGDATGSGVSRAALPIPGGLRERTPPAPGRSFCMGAKTRGGRKPCCPKLQELRPLGVLISLDAARSAPTPTAARGPPLCAQAAAARHLPAKAVKKSQIRERHKSRRVVASLCP
jgi:hypothetical protein